MLLQLPSEERRPQGAAASHHGTPGVSDHQNLRWGGSKWPDGKGGGDVVTNLFGALRSGGQTVGGLTLKWSRYFA